MRADIQAQFDLRTNFNNLQPGSYLTGCDWSHWQPHALDADMSDYDFFIHKVSEGVKFIDQKCQDRVSQLHKNKPCILYHFFNALCDGEKQARHFMETMHSLFSGARVGFCVDFEITETEAQLESLTAFMVKMKDYGHVPIIYCGDYSKARLTAAAFHAPLWIARWRKGKPNTFCSLWQFSNTPYDLDLFFGSMDEMSLLLEWV